MDNGEEYAKIAEAIIEECLPIPAHRVVGRLEAGIAIHDAVAAERERCAKIVAAELSEWNSGGEYYANLTLACNTIAAKIRSGE